MSKIVVGTGWWCAGEETDGIMGDNIIRSAPFFEVWYTLVMRYINPSKIIIVDSNSPVKPNLTNKMNVEIVSLDRNYLHSRALAKKEIITKYCGWTRSVFLSCCYSAMCDADLFVYVEQDCLVHGVNILKHAMEGGDSGIWLGNTHRNVKGAGGEYFSSNVVQTSLMIARSESIIRLANGSIIGPQSDGEYAPEKRLMGNCQPFNYMKIPFGRNRPILWDAESFYAQHMNKEELLEMMLLEKLSYEEFFER